MAGKVDDVVAVPQPFAHLGHAERIAHHALHVQGRKSCQLVPQLLELLGDPPSLLPGLGELGRNRPLLASEVLQEGRREDRVADDENADGPGRPAPRLPQRRRVHEDLAPQGVAQSQKRFSIVQELPRVAHQLRGDLET